MNKKLVAFTVLLVVLLGVAAVLVMNTRYREPRGAAAGGASGCGGGEEQEPAVPDAGAASWEDVVQGLAPAQIHYYVYQGDKPCTHVSIEPGDSVASVEDLCRGLEVQVYDLTDEQSKGVLAAFEALKESDCVSCPPPERFEVLMSDEKTRYLPYADPLKPFVQQFLSQYSQEAGLGTEGAKDVAPAASMTLKPEFGARFAESTAEAQSSPLSADLICYASSQTVDLQAGAGPTMAKQKHLKLFRTPGGTVQKFGSLDEVPAEIPADTDRDMVHHAKAGNGFVVENNVSPGYTRVFIKDAGEGYVVLEYQMFQ
jgi:hypothetical protein